MIRCGAAAMNASSPSIARCSQIPSAYPNCPGVALQSTAAIQSSTPVPALENPARSCDAGPLPTLLALLDAGFARSASRPAPAGSAERTVAIVVDDIATLLLAHPTSDVVAALMDISRGAHGSSSSRSAIVPVDTRRRCVLSRYFTSLQRRPAALYYRRRRYSDVPANSIAGLSHRRRICIHGAVGRSATDGALA